MERTFAGLRQFYNKTTLVDNAFHRQSIRNYEIINAANTVIENINKVTDPENKTMAAEATF
jgi:GMP synthase PP-ATPase subunit